jgi:hypothetical protein
LSLRFFSQRAPLPSLSCGPTLPITEPLPPRTCSLSLCRGPPLSTPPSPRPPWTSARTRAHRQDPRPHHYAHAQPFLSPARARTHSPASVHAFPLSLSLALLTPPDPAGDPRPPPRPSSSPETAPSHPELFPEVRHPCPCSISPISLCRRPTLASSVFGRGETPGPRGDRPNWLSPIRL